MYLFLCIESLILYFQFKLYNKHETSELIAA